MADLDDHGTEQATDDPPAPVPAEPTPDDGRARERPRPKNGKPAEAKPEAEDADDEPEPETTKRKWVKPVVLTCVVVGLAFGAWKLTPWVEEMLTTVSTDDAYVNGHVTSLAPRVSGQVTRVLVDDNMRVKRGDVLVQLDREPYDVKLAISQAQVTAAEADLTAAHAQAQATLGQIRASRFQLDHAIEDVNTRVADLQADVASLNSSLASLDLARANLKRGEQLLPGGGISKEDLDVRRQTVKVDEANVEKAYQAIYSMRVGLGLQAKPAKGESLGSTPKDLSQTYSGVRTALGSLIESAAQLGYAPSSWNAQPQQLIDEFYKQDPSGNLDNIYKKILQSAPMIKQSEAKLMQARRDLDQAKLDLRYCDVVSEIDGVVTRRNVNPGNNVQAGQALMAIRSLTEIWVDANFKETQLRDLRIGQRTVCEIDMYGSKREMEGRITGFTMGTGQSLSLLPPQNATGNYVKVVQRLPVRIEFTDYNPDKTPLFVGLSVVPRVYYKEKAEGAHAGEVLQPLRPLASRPTTEQSPLNPMPANEPGATPPPSSNPAGNAAPAPGAASAAPR